MGNESRPRVLCVDDEPQVLQGLARQLRRYYDVQGAVGGAAGLELMARERFPIVISDMRMPGMDGTQFLSRVRERYPDTVRILLTGQADMESAIAAINDGNVFRFLCKPCLTDELIRSLDAAMELVRLRQAERELLEQTLRGSVQALIDTLALANPRAFGSARRVRDVVGRLCDRLAIEERWEIDIAAMLSYVGAVAIPDSVIAKRRSGAPLSSVEAGMFDQMPALADSLLAHIPRLERVREMIARRTQPLDETTPIGARVLRVAFDAEPLEERGLSAREIFQQLKATGEYDPAVLLAYIGAGHPPEVRDEPVQVRELCVGMVLTADVETSDGLVLVSRNHAVTEGTLVRLRNFAACVGVREPLRVASASKSPTVDAAVAATPHGA